MEKVELIALMARSLHEAGVTTDRLEATLLQLARALDVQLQVFALPTYVTLAIGEAHRQEVVMLRLGPGSIDLRRLASLGEIQDAVVRGGLEPREAIERIRQATAAVRPPFALLTVLEYAAISFGVSVLLGAQPHEMLVASLVGCSTGAIAALARRNAVVARLFEVLATFLGTLVVAVATRFLGPTNLYITIVAGIVPLLPGYSLTSAIYELANNDLVAGVARLGKVLVTLLALGCGAALGITVAGADFVAHTTHQARPVGMLMWTLAVMLISLGLAPALGARKRDIPWVFAACFLALLSSRILSSLPGHQAAPFGSAFFTGIVCYVEARLARLPVVVLLAPAIFVLVPGALTYESIFFAFQENFESAAQLAANAFIASIFIVAGLLLSQLVFATGGTMARSIVRGRH
ncbi:MAG: threonine/serine exporter family protein [Candidatus Eremiobacteraeota bacterium]|nr:threonine/serine exporter family protein [Candidatus Eremiobacteraeota bacterium]